MKQYKEKKVANQRDEYVSPIVSLIMISGDIITESHDDPNMGEWDTEE